MKKNVLIEYLDEYTTQSLMNLAQRNRDVIRYFIPIAFSLRSLIKEGLYDFDVECIAYRKEILESKELMNKKFNIPRWRQREIDNVQKTPGLICHIIENRYIDIPSHIIKKNNRYTVDWRKFNTDNHLDFLNECISLAVVSRLRNEKGDRHWDGTDLLLEPRKKLFEGSRLGCDKKSYDYALNVFENTADDIRKILSDSGFYIKEISTAGSLRRKKSIVGDIDLIVLCEGHKNHGYIDSINKDIRMYRPLKQMAHHVLSKKILNSNKAFSDFVFQFENSGMQCDFFFTTPCTYAVKRLQMTGSAPHNAMLMYEGFKKNLVLSLDYFYNKNNKKFIYPKNEEEIFENLGMSYKEPENRI